MKLYIMIMLHFHHQLLCYLQLFFLYFPSILLPFLDMTISSREQKISLLQSIEIVYQEESYFLALAIFLLILFAPIVRIAGMLLIILPKHFNKKPIFNKKMIRFIAKISPWNMVEVYLFAVVVTLIKISSLAIIHTSQGFFAFVFFIIINTFISYLLPSKRIWQML